MVFDALCVFTSRAGFCMCVENGNEDMFFNFRNLEGESQETNVSESFSCSGK